MDIRLSPFPQMVRISTHKKSSRFPCASMYGMTYAQLKAHAAAQMRERAKERKIAAAKRALSILNKLPPGEFRKKNISRVFSNLNKLRAA